MFDSIKKALAYLQLAQQIALMVVEFVKTFEAPGNGQEKQNAVIEIVQAAWEHLVPAEIKKSLGLESLEKFIKVVIEIAVKVFHATGVFVKA